MATDLKKVLNDAVALLDEYGNDGRALGIAYNNELSKLSDYDGLIPSIGMMVTRKGVTSWGPAPKPSKLKYVGQQISAQHGEGGLHYVLRIGKDNGGNVRAVALAIEAVKLLAAAA